MVDQPSHKSFKIRGHSRQRRTSKPYSRPNDVKNKGIIDKVRDYLSPSWLIGYFTSNKDEIKQSKFEEEEETDDYATVTHEEGSTSSSFEPNQRSLTLTPLEEENGDAFESFDMDNDQNVITTVRNREEVDLNTREAQDIERNPNISIRLSGSLDDDVEDENERRDFTKQIAQNQSLSYISDELKRKPLPSLLHSRSSSSSLLLQRGMSSVRNKGTMFGSTPTQDHASTSKFLSISVASSSVGRPTGNKLNVEATRPTSLGIRNTSTNESTLSRGQVQTIDSVGPHTCKSSTVATPLFSVEKFVTPVQRSFINKRVGSPNYPGPVTYGGAMNVSRDIVFKRRKMSTSPSNESYHPVSKLRVRAVKERRLPNSSLGGSGTKTAQRILDALESVSSPLKDVRRIPSPISLASASPLSFVPSRMRTTPPKTKVGPRVSYLQAKLIGNPPVSALQTPEFAKVSVIQESSTSHDIQPNPTDKPTLKSSVEDSSLFSGLKNTVLKSSLPTSFAPKTLPTSLSPVENLSKTSGKMKTASRRDTMHYSSNKNSQENKVVNPLPEINVAIPLSLKTSKKLSLPMFNSTNTEDQDNDTESTFSKSTISSKESLLNGKMTFPKNGFAFSSPAQIPQRFSVKESLEMAENEVSFSFSDPIPIKNKQALTLSQASKPATTALITIKNTPNNIISFATGSEVTLAGSDVTSADEPLGNSVSSKDNDFVQIHNEANGEKCAPCTTEKPEKLTNQEKPVTDLKSMIRNDNELSNCGTVESKRPGILIDLKSKFAASSGSWECPTCMIQNKSTDIKCVACETNKPGANADVALKLKSASDKNTSKPGTEDSFQSGSSLMDKKTSFSSGFIFNAGNGGQTSSGSGFTFGAGDGNYGALNAGATFTFGQPSDATKSSNFTFGNNTTTLYDTATSKSDSSTTVSETNPTSGLSFSTGNLAKTSSPITFGGDSKKNDVEKTKLPSITSSSFAFSTVKNDVLKTNEKPSKTSFMNIAEAAAGGLLNLPGKEAVKAQPAYAGVASTQSNPTVNFSAGVTATSLGGTGVEQIDGAKDSTINPPVSSSTVTKPFTFQNKTSSVTDGLFTFGAQKSTSSVASSTLTTADPKPTPLFSFTPTSSSVPSTTPSIPSSSLNAPFSFNVSSSQLPKSTPTAGSLFNFGGSGTTSTTTSTPSNPAPLFSFIGSAATEEAKTTPVFNFGGVNGPVSNNNANVSSATSATSGIFSFTASQPSVLPLPPLGENSNSMGGGEEMDADSNNNHDQTASFPQSTGGGFNFAAANTGTSSVGLFGSAPNMPQSASAGFNFAGNTGVASSFQFGSTSNTPSGGFNFSSSTPAAGSSPFVFGGSTTPAGSNSSAPKLALNSTPTGGDKPVMFNPGATGTRVYKKAVRRKR